MRLKDKIGIVTAAGSVWAAPAPSALPGSARVAVVDLDGASVDAVVEEITAAGGKAIGITTDLRKMPTPIASCARRRIPSAASTSSGTISAIRTGIGRGIDMADFALAVDLNLRSQIVTTEAALPELKARGGGSLLYTARPPACRLAVQPVYSAVSSAS